MLEAPITLLVICLITLVIIQLGVWFHGYLMVHAISADLCRIVAADDSLSTHLLTSYANDRMQALGEGSAWRIPGSLRVSTQGDKRSHVAVTVQIEQRPLPLIRTMSVGLVPDSVTIAATSQVAGTYHQVDGEARAAPYRFGDVAP